MPNELMKSRFFIVGYFGFGNAGDDAIGVATTEYIRSSYPSSEITCTSGEEGLFDDTNVKTVRFAPKSVTRAVLNTDTVIITGGSHFHDRYPTFLSGMKVFTFYLYICIISKILCRDLKLIGHGIGPLTNPVYRSCTALITTLADEVTVRDPNSEQVTPRIGTKPKTTFDLGVLLNAKQEESANGERRTLGLSVTPAFKKDLNQPERNQVFLSDIKRSLEQFATTNDIKEVRIYVFHTGEYNSDYEMSKSLATELDVPTSLVLYQNDPEAFLSDINKSDLFMGMKYHSLVFAYLYEIPSAAISYHPKCVSFREYVGYPSRSTIRMEEANQDNVENLLKNLSQTPEEFVPSLTPDKARHLASQNFEEL